MEFGTRNLFKKNAVFASASVVIQQPSAIVRAAALIDPKYFVGHIIDREKVAPTWEIIKKYAPVAGIKDMGYFDTNMGKSTVDYLKGPEHDGVKDYQISDVNVEIRLSKSNLKESISKKIDAVQIAKLLPVLETKFAAANKHVGIHNHPFCSRMPIHEKIFAKIANTQHKHTNIPAVNHLTSHLIVY